MFVRFVILCYSDEVVPEEIITIVLPREYCFDSQVRDPGGNTRKITFLFFHKSRRVFLFTIRSRRPELHSKKDFTFLYERDSDNNDDGYYCRANDFFKRTYFRPGSETRTAENREGSKTVTERRSPLFFSIM